MRIAQEEVAVSRDAPYREVTRPEVDAMAGSPGQEARCPLCESPRVRLRFPGREGAASLPHAPEAYRCTSFGHRDHGPIWRCLGCGVLFQWPLPTEEALLQAYGDVEDPVYEAERENRYLTFRRALGLLGPANGRRLLDVGAYCGYFVDVARQAGFAAEGVELSRWAAERARGLGLTVHNESLAARAASGERYDVLTLWDVIEHLADPRAELARCRELLRQGGRLHVSTIDAASLVARALGPRWPWLMDMHLVYFDHRTLPALLEHAGFRVVDRRLYTHIVSADYLLRKAGASFRPLSPLTGLLRRVVPGRLPVPVNLGDNMVITAERR